jgi:hypothetical protein
MLPDMNRSPIIRRYALVPTGPADGGVRRWGIRPYDEDAACLTSCENASTSSGVVSHEHIQRTSPVVSSQT